MSLKVSILTESGVGIGYGHLTRMTALSEQLTRDNYAVTFIVDHRGPDLNWFVHPFRVARWHDNPNLAGHDDIVVIDSYVAERRVYQALKAQCCALVAIDDYDRLDYGAHAVINPNPSNVVGGDRNGCRFRGGQDWVLLRTGIRRAPAKARHEHTVKRVVITVGGSDNNDALPDLMKMAEGRWSHIDVLAGTDEYANQLKGHVSPRGMTVHGAVAAGTLAELFRQSDFVISACGQTLHELAFLGVPVIGICAGDDQFRNQTFYLDAGLLGSRIDCRVANWLNLVEEESEELADRRVRENRSARGRTLIDGNGPSRVSSLLSNLRQEVCSLQ